MTKMDESAELFLSGYSCSQSVFIPQGKAGGLDAATAARLASGFGAGMGKMQKTCGALTGAFMAMGLSRGFSESADAAGKARIMAEVKEAGTKFTARFGSMDCANLLGCDLNTEEGQRFHRESGQRESVCLECVRFAAGLVEDLSEGPS
jgi:C_GCAxxG_C_C family probable redox protein